MLHQTSDILTTYFQGRDSKSYRPDFTRKPSNGINDNGQSCITLSTFFQHNTPCLRSQARKRKRSASSPEGCHEDIVWEARPRNQTVVFARARPISGEHPTCVDTATAGET